MPKFASQFEPFKQEVNKALYQEPVEGFQPGQCESLSKLVKRLSVGQDVLMIQKGVYSDSQIFDTQMIDEFDYLDRCDELSDQIRTTKQAPKAAEETPPGLGDTPPDDTPPA